VFLRRALLAFAVLASAAVTAVLGFAIYLFVAGYSGGSNPQSVAPVAFPLSFLVVLLVGLPAALVCAAAWVGYSAAARRSRKSWR
jgi:drug/metabolite transporter (DMT)-like permease